MLTHSTIKDNSPSNLIELAPTNRINDNSSNFKSRVYKVVFNTEEYKNEKPSSSANILRSFKNLSENSTH